MSDQGETTQLIQFGKYSGILMPEVYFQFVSKLHREHPDLIAAMTLARVRLEDGSARDYLNSIFETNVTKEMSMADGFKIFLDKLDQRRNNQIAQRKIREVANEFAKPTQEGYKFRDEEHQGKPLFPSIEEQEDRGDK